MLLTHNPKYPTIITKHPIYEAGNGASFTQYIGPSSIATSHSLLPGDVIINIESCTVSYIGENGQCISWTSVVNASQTRHPTLIHHYILVLLQTHFSWLSYNGYQHWDCQAREYNPTDSLNAYIRLIMVGRNFLPDDTGVGQVGYNNQSGIGWWNRWWCWHWWRWWNGLWCTAIYFTLDVVLIVPKKQNILQNCQVWWG